MNRLVLAASLTFAVTLAATVAATLAACGAPAAGGPGTVSAASPGAGGGSEVGPGSDVECHDEIKTGSSIPRRVCRSKDQSDDDRQGAQNFINQPHTVPVPPTH
jgi:hypothetical protein